MIEPLASPTPLATRLRERIAREGPITFCDWMKAALYDPDDGYYCKSGRGNWGREGDYRTSPERNGLFAATLARYFSKLHAEAGSPAKWIILECGAGDGHFAEGLLQTLRGSYPNVFAATSYVVDEASSLSQARAAARLRPFADRVQFKALDEVEIEAGVVFSNELLDAFPVHRITRHESKLREFYVTVGESDNFEWTIGEPAADLEPRLAAYFNQPGIQLEESQIAEVSLETEDWLRKVAARLGRGYIVSVDYGRDAASLFSEEDGTLRGFQRHQFVEDLLARPGEHDLTTTVNWTFVKSAGKRLGLRIDQFERQDKFLLDAGFLQQLEIQSQLCRTEAERLRLTTAAREMILPDGMASHFQVLVQQKT
ncbi:MAG TPA: SAM-dependent methyltransferase [Pyrinomonadaceae bacterium]|jgi:SAM-dependent MidA family methyltransferase|nr:SAM-dependent methyltransferase [Pyrinomonadaceae bacterium]